MAFKKNADVYGCRTPNPRFFCAADLITAKSMSPRIIAVVWLSWLMIDSASFTRFFIDQYNAATKVQFGHHSSHKATENHQNYQTQDRLYELASAHQVGREAQIPIHGQVPQDPPARNRQGSQVSTGLGEGALAPGALQMN